MGETIGPQIVQDFGHTDDGPFAVFDTSGRLLGNLTSNQGQVPNSLPNLGNDPSGGITLPSVGGSAGPGAAAGASIPQAASIAGITGGSIPPSGTTGNTASGSSANNWFVRAVVVILGFVFVAVGLSQFGVVQNINPLRRG